MTQPKTILVVDDDAPLRISLGLILRKEGYQVETAANGEEGLERLQSAKVDLVFLDLNMPGMTGTELLVQIHAKYPRLPILILTAHATMDSAVQAVRSGARDYLLKPAEPAMILARVAEILAELDQPNRQRELVGQLQSLLSELQQIEGAGAIPPGRLASLTVTNSDRFLEKGPFNLDLQARHATLKGRYIEVTGVYFDYLAILLRHAPKAVSNRLLVKETQGFDVSEAEARDLARWRIHELRRIVETKPEQPKYILTVRGVGYRLAV
jgi:DNA-binding response OmpR family regulator